MPYQGDASQGIKQEFTPCFSKGTASWGYAMCWTFPDPPSTTTNFSTRPTFSTPAENLGYWAYPAWEKGLWSFAGILWNHERDVTIADREAMLITRGYAPRIHTDCRIHVVAGNNYPDAIGNLVPNIPLGLPNSGVAGGTLTFADGVMWPQNRAASDAWHLVGANVACLDTVTADSTGSVRGFLGGTF